MMHLMVVPARLLAAVLAGSAYVDGALVKSAASHLILGHLQPTSLLGSAVLGPLWGVLDTALSVEGLRRQAQTAVEIERLKSMVETVETIALAGTVASVVGIGVSIGGFALTLRALKNLDRKLDVVMERVQQISDWQFALLVARINTALIRAEEAFRLPEAERRRRWEDAEKTLHEVSDEIVHVLARRDVIDITVRADSPGDTAIALLKPESRFMLQYLGQVVSARYEALLCLRMAKEAAHWQQHAGLWFNRLPCEQDLLATAMGSRRILPPKQLRQIAIESKAISTWVSAAQVAAVDGQVVAQALHQSGSDSFEYVERVRAHPERRLLFMPHGPEGMAMAG